MTMQNDATGKPPTVAEEMARFQSVAFKDGEVSNDTAKEGSSDQEAREARAAQVNGRTHQENVDAGKTGTEGTKDNKGAEGDGKSVELTDAEKDAALEAAAKTDGEDLSDEEKEAVLATALASKQRTAAVAARKAAKAARYTDAHRTAKAAERRADAAERRAADLERRLAAVEAGGAKAPLTGDKAAGNNDEADKPDHTDTEKYPYGELDPKYLRDLSRYEAKAAIREDQEKARTASQAAADKEAQDAFKERVATFAEAGEEEFEDFHETVMEALASKENPDGWPCSATLGELLMESEHGPAIAYALATDVAEARRVFKLPEPRQAIWFGKKEAELDTAGSAANGQPDGKTPAAAAGGTAAPKVPVRESKAPPPPSKLPGGNGNRVPNAATTNFADFEAMALAPKR